MENKTTNNSTVVLLPKIYYADKEKINDDVDLPDKNKVTDKDLNEIKRVVNELSDYLEDAMETIAQMKEKL